MSDPYGRSRQAPYGGRQPPQPPPGYAPYTGRDERDRLMGGDAPPERQRAPPRPTHDEYSREKPSRSSARVPPPSRNQLDMTPRSFRVQKSTNEFIFSNRVIVSPGDFPPDLQYIAVNRDFIFSIEARPFVEPGHIAPSRKQREWAQLSFGIAVNVTPFDISTAGLLGSVSLEIDFIRPPEGQVEVQATAIEDLFKKVYRSQVFSVGQSIVFEHKGIEMQAGVSSVEVMDMESLGKQGGGARAQFGVLTPETEITFTRKPTSQLRIKANGKKARTNAILTPDFKFEDMGIGGLDKEFSAIFRRAFASRIFPPYLVEKLGIDHVKGILLYGPPGTGKTLIARQIGKMLNAKEPKIVNGPEILSKYVGQSEENIRKLFGDAEADYKELGEESPLHIIIFDELDAICKQRGSKNDGTGVGDTVVNQLLSKMDGVDQLNNILIIGMTNRKDMIDEALLRPGRLEVHMEISLPDEFGRLQILKIHTAKMRNNNVMDRDVRLEELASQTKNFSGAEISGLIKSATSFSFNRHVKVGTLAGVADDIDQMKVSRDDFLSALEEVRPAFGVSDEELEQCIQNGIIHYHERVEEILENGRLGVDQVRSSKRTPLVSMLLQGPPGSGKTALAAQIAMNSEFPFIKLISPESMVGMTESAKVSYINKIFSDSYRSEFSVVVIDNIERILEWVDIGPRFSNTILQALMVLLKKLPPRGRRLLIIATTSERDALQRMGLYDAFDVTQAVPNITTFRELVPILTQDKAFTDDECREVKRQLEYTGQFDIGVKKVLTLVEKARQDQQGKIDTFVQDLEQLMKDRTNVM